MANPAQQEFTLVQQAQNGSLEAFNALVMMYQDSLYNIAYRLMGDAESAADVTQEALITAYQKLDSFHGGNFRAWLARIVTNQGYDELRRQKRRPADYFDDLPGGDTDDGAPVPAPTLTPEQTVQENELHQAIHDCIQSLGADQRLVMILSDIQGLSYQEIADNAGINIGTVKSRLSRARLAVRRCLQQVSELLPSEYRLLSSE